MIKAQLNIDGKNLINSTITDEEICVGVKNMTAVLTNPLLVKVGLNMKPIISSSGSRKLRFERSMFSQIFG